MEVDLAYIVSVMDLREICKELTHGRFKYEVTSTPDDVTIIYNEGTDNFNSSIFTFPIVRYLGLPFLPRTEDGLMACLHTYTHTQSQQRMYMENGEIRFDNVTDWLRFWVPLDAVLLKKSTIPGLV
jgi:hypothetical protein